MVTSAESPRVRTFSGRYIDWTPRDVLIAGLWFLAFFLVIPLVFGIPFFLVYGEDSPITLGALLILSIVAEVGVTWAAYDRSLGKYGGSLLRYGFRRPTWSTAGWALLGVVVAIGILIGWDAIIRALDIEALKSACDDQIPADVQDNVALIVITGIAVVIFAPLCEEFIFRGFVLQSLGAHWGIIAGVVLSAIIWGGPHALGSYKPVVPITLIGIVFALIYWRSGNIFSTMLAHVAFNTIGFSALVFSDCNPDSTAMAVLRMVRL